MGSLTMNMRFEQIPGDSGRRTGRHATVMGSQSRNTTWRLNHNNESDEMEKIPRVLLIGRVELQNGDHGERTPLWWSHSVNGDLKLDQPGRAHLEWS